MSFVWPGNQRVQALQAVTHGAGLAKPLTAGRAADGTTQDVQLGVEAHSVRVTYDSVPQMVARGGPALLQVQGRDTVGWLALLGPADLLGRVPLMTPQGRVQRVRVPELTHILREGIEASVAPLRDALFEGLPLRPRQQRNAEALWTARHLHGRPMGGGVLVRAAPHGALSTNLRDARVLGPLFAAFGLSLTGTVLALGGWATIGQGALEGRMAPGWVAGWTLLILSGLVLQFLSRWLQGRAALRGAAWMKQALLRGALKTDPDTFLKEGVGQQLARVNESQAVEDVAVSGGLALGMAAIDGVAGAWILSHAAYPALWMALLAVTTAAVLWGAWQLAHQVDRWTNHRRHLTHLLVERMTGHQTRRIQGHPDHRFRGEDEALEAYADASQRHDSWVIGLAQLPTTVFLVASLVLLSVPLVLGQLSTAQIAITVGGILWTQSALSRGMAELKQLADARTSWRQIQPLWQAARAVPNTRRPPEASPASKLLQARALDVGWPHQPPVLHQVDLTIRRGEHLLLTGPSGSGKSTLAATLTGLQSPQGGLLLLQGLDRATLGDNGWQRHAVQAPQFHRNHIFQGTLAFNLLLGRAWPPQPEDLHRARALCEQLGMGDLIRQMPAGLNQTLGESGWQLSHGEQSRLFLARALLAQGDLVVLDESFAALDPPLVHQCLAVAEAQAPSLMVVAHP